VYPAPPFQVPPSQAPLHPQQAPHSPHYGQYAPQPYPPRTSPIVWVLAAMGLMAVLGAVLGTCGVVVGLAALGASSDEPTGVVLGAQVPQKTVDALRERRLLAANEGLLAYHDATLRLDMSEVTFVTPERVVHAHGETVTAIKLAEVNRITHHDEALVGDILDIATRDGRVVRIEIAPLNGGDAYANVLETAWRKHHPEARIDRAKR
jgi:hypothetical protein